jgi:hypothetical protein
LSVVGRYRRVGSPAGTPDMVPILYRGARRDMVRDAPPMFDGDVCEGYVGRVAREFRFSEFRHVMFKWVRAHHVQTHGHWLKQIVMPNGLRSQQGFT